jgi:NAD(P)-dependent dehydrogenase (short-subunit alcohol dehydrogenase family)
MVDRQTNTVLLAGASRGLGLAVAAAFINRG